MARERFLALKRQSNVNLWAWRLGVWVAPICMIGLAVLLFLLILREPEMDFLLLSLLTLILGLVPILCIQFYNMQRVVWRSSAINFDAPLTLRMPTWQRFFYVTAWSTIALGFSGFFPASVAMAYGYRPSSDILPLLMGVSVALFLLLLGVFGRLAKIFLPVLLLDRAGLDHSRFGCGPINWFDIRNIEIQISSRIPPMITLMLPRSEHYIARASGFWWVERFSHRQLGYNLFRMMPDTLGVTPEFLYAAVAAYRAYHVEGEAPPSYNPPPRNSLPHDPASRGPTLRPSLVRSPAVKIVDRRR